MTSSDIINIATSQVGYHEKVTNTPVADLYAFQNAYDGHDNWTKYHHDIGVGQGQAWCGFFCYWLFRMLIGNNSDTTAFLHNIQYYGGAVSSWATAFSSANLYHENDGYVPKPGDIVIFSDTGYPWSHCELVIDISLWPNYIINIGGNTRNPNDPGSQSEGMWVAQRTRSATATSGFHVRGYCEVLYDDIPIGLLTDEMMAYYIHRKRKGMYFDWWNR